MYRFFDKIRSFMYGRYGIDKLGKFSLVVYFIIAVANIFLRNLIAKNILFTIQWAMLILIFFRMFSRNISARQNENRVFEKFSFRVEPKFKLLTERVKNIGSKRYRTCPNCKAVSRLPIKRGKHYVKCPKCRIDFKVFILI